MTKQDMTAMSQGADTNLGQVLAWAEANGESYDAIRELAKIPARAGMIDDDIGLIPAGLVHFDKVLAPSSYGAVSNAADLETSRKRGNARVRALLTRFHASRAALPVATGREDWDRLIAFSKEHEGFVDRGALFTTGRHRALFVLRARCRTGPADLTQEELDRVFADATSEGRRAIRKAIRLINELIALQNAYADLVGRVPPTGFTTPGSPDRARRILWESLPAMLREDVEAMFRETLDRPEDRAARVKARRNAGEDAETVLAEVNASVIKHRKMPKNSKTALAGYRGAVTWLWRAAEDRGQSNDITGLADLMSREMLEAACGDQITRSTNSITLKDPKKSQTLNGRLTNLRTVARHGLKRTDLVAEIDLMKIAYWEYIVTPKQMTDEADHTCRMLRDNPEVAARFVRGPYTLADRTLADLEAARANGNDAARDRALRLYAAAVMTAIQLSRPLRTSNLIRTRHRGAPGIAGNVTWIRDRKHAELSFPKGEIKNDAKVVVTVLGRDAEILWDWQETLRAEFVELRGLADSPYLFPGAAKPRLVKDDTALPPGCMAPSTMAEIWALGDAHLGLGLTPHECRHAVATLSLAMEPGNFAKAAAILGDTEETVRKHYGCDSGQAAAVGVRQALLDRHPDLFKLMKRKHEK